MFMIREKKETKKGRRLGLGVIAILFLFTACGRKESGTGQALLEETQSEQAFLEETESEEIESEETEAVLEDVIYDGEAEPSEPARVQFVFSDGTTEERELDYTDSTISWVDHYDMTGDGIEEVVVHRKYVDTAAEYRMLDIFQVEGKEIRQIFPNDDIARLQGKPCDTQIFTVDRDGRNGNGLYVKTYQKENMEISVEEEAELFYEGGKWIELPERELHVEVSLESDREEAQAYESFLKGECKAEVSGHYYSETEYLNPLSDNKEGFYFQDALKEVVEGIRDRCVDGMERIEYALIDCGNDGKPELALRFYGVSIYSMHDSSSVVMIFDCVDGQVELIYAVDAWARSSTDIYPDGYVQGGGSGGASTHYVSEGIIGADGVFRSVYEMCIESGGGFYEMKPYPYEENGEETLWATFFDCTMGEEKVYAYEIADVQEDVRENIKSYIRENEEYMGVKFLTYEEMDALIDERALSLGVTKEMSERLPWEAEGIPWQTLKGCEDYLYE